jgi:hypothetical protein
MFGGIRRMEDGGWRMEGAMHLPMKRFHQSKKSSSNLNESFVSS